MQPQRLGRGLATLAALVLIGCGDDDGILMDAGGADASVIDADLDIDASPRMDAAIGDAGGIDAGIACSGPCDPRIGTCADDGVCLLAEGAAMCAATGGDAGVPDAGWPDAGAGAQEGAPCGSSLECAVGLSCFARREGGGACGHPCCPGDAAGCRDAERCGGPGLLADGSSVGWRECLPQRPCNVLMQDECEVGEGCYIVAVEDGEPQTDCREAGRGEVGDPCRGQNDCAPGFSCAGQFEATCARICAIGDDASCPAAEGSCQGYSQSPAGTGLCTLDASAQRR